MDKKAKIVTISALVVVGILISMLVFAAPKKCRNGVDDDNDGLIDYRNDPGCSSRTDNTETGTAICDNGVDEANDADALADFRLSVGDPGCSSVTDNNERDGPCDDLSDNDFDGFTDYPSDPECTSFASGETNCADTDGGVVLGIQGTVTGSYGGVPFNSTDFCNSAINLTEYSCGFYGNLIVDLPLCHNSTTCVNGACV